MASTRDNYEQLPDRTRIMPFNDIVTDPSGSSNGAGITVTVSGKYEVSVTTACVKGRVRKFLEFVIKCGELLVKIFVKIFVKI